MALTLAEDLFQFASVSTVKTTPYWINNKSNERNAK